MGTLEGTIPNAPPNKLFKSNILVVLHLFEEFGGPIYNGGVYRVFGKLYMLFIQVEGSAMGTLEGLDNDSAYSVGL
jgi:hypothetical protein